MSGVTQDSIPEELGCTCGRCFEGICRIPIVFDGTILFEVWCLKCNEVLCVEDSNYNVISLEQT